MVEKPSATAVVFGIMVLHAIILEAHKIVAEEASTPVYKKQARSKHLSHQVDSAEYVAADATAAATREQQHPPTSLLNPHGGTERKLKSCMGWHVELSNQDGCSDDNKNPDQWIVDEGLKQIMFHPTKEACCEMMFSRGDCKVYETGCLASAPVPPPPIPPPPVPPPVVSSPRPEPAGPPSSISTSSNANCVSPGWHPDLDTDDGCTNDDNYPTQWLKEQFKRNMFHSTPQKCCSIFFAGEDCGEYDRGCSIDSTMTEKRTRAPTPTQAPTPEPTTTSPTETPPSYYIGHSTGICVEDNAENPKPYYIQTIFHNIILCCRASFAPEKCLEAIPDDVISQQEPLPPEYYLPHSSSICVDSSDPGMAKPFYISESFSDYHECCIEASPDILQCLDAAPEHIGEYNPPEISDTVIKVHMFGSVMLQLSSVPKYNSADWATLRSVFINTITAVMLESPIVNQGIVVQLFTFAGKSMKRQLRRRLGKSSVKKNITMPSSKAHSQRQATQMESLEFEMTIPVRCNAICQVVNGPLGEVASKELEEHWAWYVDTRAFSSLLHDMGKRSGLFNNDAPPSAKSGELTYRSAVDSFDTLIPTWAPTLEVPPHSPNLSSVDGTSERKPLEPMAKPVAPANTKSYTISYPDQNCEAAQWHPLEDFSSPTCTNSFFYPGLWNSPSVKESFLFDSPEDCCGYYGFVSCNIEDICASAVPVSDSADVNTAEPTNYPTLIEHEWYVDWSINKCVQDFGQKSAWADSYSSAEECCTIISWKPLGDCMTVASPTIAPADPPTKKPTRKPRSKPTKRPSLTPSTSGPTSVPTTECAAYKWYYKMSSGVCSNDSSYPSLWDHDKALGSKFLYDSVEECCAANSPSLCPVQDICFMMAHPSYCGALHHPTTPGLRICTNGVLDYPQTWDSNPKFMFQSAEECCRAFYGDGLCITKDACY